MRIALERKNKNNKFLKGRFWELILTDIDIEPKMTIYFFEKDIQGYNGKEDPLKQVMFEITSEWYEEYRVYKEV